MLIQKNLCLLHILLIYGILSLGQPVFAAIMVVSGDNQTVFAGANSEEIVFKVIDEQGNPKTNLTVNFGLTNSKDNTIVQEGLTTYTAETDDNGQVSTRLTDTSIINSYTITATLATDTTQSMTTKVIVIAGAATQLTVQEGDNQTVAAGKTSAIIRFQLTDAADNIVSGQSVNFKVITPNGNTNTGNLFTATAISDINGEVTTRLEAPDATGKYTVIATLATNEAVTANTTVQVTEAILELPSLGFGAAIDKDWKPVETTAIFHGGTSVNQGNFNQEVILTIDDTILIQGLIKVDNNHVELAADIIILAGYQPTEPANTEEIFVMLDNNNAVQPWDGNIDTLVSFMRVTSLAETQMVKIYDAQFQEAGKLQIYFGYRLDNGIVVFNASQAINILINLTMSH